MRAKTENVFLKEVRLKAAREDEPVVAFGTKASVLHGRPLCPVWMPLKVSGEGTLSRADNPFLTPIWVNLQKRLLSHEREPCLHLTHCFSNPDSLWTTNHKKWLTPTQKGLRTPPTAAKRGQETTHLETHAMRSKTMVLDCRHIGHIWLCVRRRPPLRCDVGLTPLTPFTGTCSLNFTLQNRWTCHWFFSSYVLFPAFLMCSVVLGRLILNIKVLTRSNSRHAFWGLWFLTW